MVLKGAGAVVKNNRKLHDVGSYTYLFRENMAGSGRLTRAMQQRLRGLGNVAPPMDLVNSHKHDILDDRVYDRRKEECKQRECLYDHWSPPCSSHSKAQAHNLQRSKDAPYGDGEIRPSVAYDSKVAVRVGALARIKHEVGDFFSIEHIYPTYLLSFESYVQLLNLPGVFVLTWDNCRFGEAYRHQQCLVVNAVFLALLGLDCDGAHKHLTIGFDKDIRADQLNAFAWGYW